MTSGRLNLSRVAEVLAKPILTTGEWVARFERRFAEHLGAVMPLLLRVARARCIFLCLRLASGLATEVITTPMTFIATATAIIEVGC